MKREEFSRKIRALSPLEIRLKNGENIDQAFYRVLEQNGMKDHDGYYLFPKNIRPLIDAAGPDNRNNGDLRSRLFESVLQNKLRLIINNRFSRDRLHYDAFIGINFVYSGHLIIHFPDRQITLNSGQLCLMGEKVVHSYEIQGENDLILSLQLDRNYLDSRFLCDFSGSSPIADFLMSSIFGKECSFTWSVFDCGKSDKTQLLFEDLFCEYIEPGIMSEALSENFVRMLFILLIRNSETIQKADSRINITGILKYIDDHFQDCTLENLAEEFRYSPKYMSRLIRQQTGLKFTDLMTRTRLNRVCIYLRNTDWSIQEIAARCGYTNQNFFYHKFQEACHMTPNEYRKTKDTETELSLPAVKQPDYFAR